MQKTIELRCKDHVDEYDRQQDSDTEVAGGLRQLPCASGKDDPITRLHVQFSSLLAHCRNSLSKGNSIQAGIDLNISLPVVTLDVIGTRSHFEFGHVAQLDHALSRRWNQQIVETGRIPERFVQPQLHFILLVALLELRIENLTANKSSD